MDDKLKIKSTVGIGGIVIGLTVMVFFIITQKIDAVDWLSLIFLLISEIALFGTIILLIRKKNFFMTIGIVMTLGIYWLAELLLCIMRFIFNQNVVVYLSTQLIVTAVIGVLLILFFTIGYNKVTE